jgi:uncharacterized protein (DUF305 family)
MSESDATESKWSIPSWVVAVLGALVLVLGALALYFFVRGDDFPANDSADVGFARDMSVHHAQAVEMANIVYGRTEDPDIALIARDIADTQQFQIGMMTGWLDIWGRSVSSDIPLMAWMSDYDMTLPSPPPGLVDDDLMVDMNMGVDDHDATATPSADVPLMPGMATQAEVDELKTLPPDQMDIRFLQLMIRHHQGGVMMAQAALEKASDEHVLNFAQQVINTQQAEINTMTDMLNDRLAASGSSSSTESPATPTADSGDMSAMPGMASPTATHEGH